MANKIFSLLNKVASGLYRRSGGKIGGKAMGLPVGLLTVNGRRTGQPHTVPVAFFEHEGSYLVTGSAGGAKTDPQWIRNLAATDRASIEMGRQRIPVAVSVLSRADRDAAWNDIILRRQPKFAKYERKSGRAIPIARLTPSAAIEPA